MADAFNLERFVLAQRETYARALEEVRQGTKQGHWMWFIFPQISGLAQSSMARDYALSGLDEARSYLAHPLLGNRLREITTTLNELPHHDAEGVFGKIDAMKLRSSLTLFAQAEAQNQSLFSQTLDRWFKGDEDEATLTRLRHS